MINNLFIVSLIVLLASTTSSARLNPFEPTKTYSEEKDALNKNKPLIQKSIDNDGKTLKITPHKQQTIVTSSPAEAVKELVKNEEVKKKDGATKILGKNMPPMDEVVIEDKEVKNTIKPLPFVELVEKGKTLSIKTKYKLKKKFVIKSENKLVFDFKGKFNFYTKRNILKDNQDFKNVTIGNHPKYSFFRVVVETKDKVSNYKVNINKQGLITISKLISN